jgi:hypothetical protein
LVVLLNIFSEKLFIVRLTVKRAVAKFVLWQLFVSHLFRETAIGTVLLKSLLHPGFLIYLVLSEAKKIFTCASFY